ncbi:MAG: L-serine ammonia-lyase, iron-sulfur-dependent, subunit alpha, partial [Planctomycetota bacterium]
MNPASIFNDVIGPVMRGPSSSHCAAALRIGRMARDLMNGKIQTVLVEFDRSGSLPNTHASQGSDMGLFGGLLGWDADDPRLPDSRAYLDDAGISLSIVAVDVGDPHPNTYRLTLGNERESHSLIAISTGGGMIRVIGIDGAIVDMDGGYHETLVWDETTSQVDTDVLSTIGTLRNIGGVVTASANDASDAPDHPAQTGAEHVLPPDQRLIQIQSDRFVRKGLVGAIRVRQIQPVLPVPSRDGIQLPFDSSVSLLQYDGERQTSLWRLACEYERHRGGLSEAESLQQMTAIVRLLQKSIDSGIAGTTYGDRVLGHQSGRFAEEMESKRLLDAGALNRITLYVTALMEVKSSMGVIVAAPTAGACAALPGAVIGMAQSMNLDETKMAKAMMAAGLIGVFITTRWTFAAEVGGCQAEGGAAACMAAAALVTLAGGTRDQCLAAASLAFQSMLGLICDPIANRV